MNIRLLAPLIAILTMATACTEQGNQAPTEKADDMAQGALLFEQNCSSCHPRSGRGDYLKRIPATLLTRRSEQELVTWIVGSNKHREMPNFNQLSNEELLALASYLRNEINN